MFKKKKAEAVFKNLIVQSLQLAPCETFLDSQLNECTRKVKLLGKISWIT